MSKNFIIPSMISSSFTSAAITVFEFSISSFLTFVTGAEILVVVFLGVIKIALSLSLYLVQFTYTSAKVSSAFVGACLTGSAGVAAIKLALGNNVAVMASCNIVRLYGYMHTH
ncbi:MAG: hypothetical protein QX191_00690, partial [Methylococcaceae bacterium]